VRKVILVILNQLNIQKNKINKNNFEKYHNIKKQKTYKRNIIAIYNIFFFK